MVVGPIPLLVWTILLSTREPWDDMEQPLAVVTIPEGYVFESEERYGASLIGVPATIVRTYVTADGVEVSGADLCTAGEINGAAVTVSDETSCRATTSADPSLLERLAFWNSGYTLLITTSRDSLPGPLILRITIRD